MPIDFQFGDGYLDLIVMRHCPKLALISLMSELDNGDHVKSPYVVYIKVSASFMAYALPWLFASFCPINNHAPV